MRPTRHPPSTPRQSPDPLGQGPVPRGLDAPRLEAESAPPRGARHSRGARNLTLLALALLLVALAGVWLAAVLVDVPGSALG